MPGGHTFNVVLQDGPNLVRVVGVHDEHDGLFEKGVVLLVGLAFQGQQAVFPGGLGQIHQLVDVPHGVKLLGVQDDAEMLWDGRQSAAGKAGHHDGEGTADNDENTGRVKEVDKVAGGKFNELLSFLGRDVDTHHNAQQEHDDSQHKTDNIGNIHTTALPPKRAGMTCRRFLYVTVCLQR